MKRNLKLILAMVCALGLAACHGANNSPPTTVDTSGIVNNPTMSNAQKAEALALSAQQLATPFSFMYAYDVADVALTYDGGNMRAQLIKAIFKPAMLTKGILNRIKPAMSVTAQGRTRYNQMLAELAQYPNGGLKTFMTDGPQDLNTELDAQALLVTIAQAYEAQRLFFKNNKNLQMTLTIPRELWRRETIKNYIDKCSATQNAPGVYNINCDLSSTYIPYNTNRAENEVGEQIAAGSEIYVLMGNSYQANGAVRYINSVQGKITSAMTPQAVYQQLLRNHYFGQIRDPQGLKSIMGMGLDGIAGMRWAISAQQSLCPTGDQNNANNRPGFVLAKGLCVNKDNKNGNGDSVDAVLRTTEYAINGGQLLATIAASDGSKSMDTQINPSAPLVNPVGDVRTLGPAWDSTGQNILSFADKTIDGVFVKGDGNEAIANPSINLKIHVK